MPLSLHDCSIPVLVRGLKNLSSCLERGRAFADGKSLAHSSLLETRLAPDMFPLTGQVQRATDTAKFTAVRVGQVANVAMADDETTFEALQARIAATIGFLDGVSPDAFAGREQAEIVLTFPGGQRTFTGRSYVLEFALPNFFFHVTTAYDLLRHQGVPIGKQDFLGWR